MHDLLTRSARLKNADQLATALQTAAQKHQFGILNVTDLGLKLREKGLAFPSMCRVFDVCQPQAAAEVLGQEMAVATVLPCRVALYEKDGGLELSTVRPTALLSHFGNPALLEAARAIEEALTQMLDEAAA
ncbi:MAG: DUF302 domain-containing protein [Terriglobales bacterium]